MVKVHLWLGLRTFTGGEECVEVEARNIDEVLKGLADAHPALAPVIEAGVSVAVDGRMIANDVTEPVYPDSEIYLLQQLKGG